MTTKIIYFLVNGKLEKAEFSTADDVESIRGKGPLKINLHASINIRPMVIS